MTRTLRRFSAASAAVAVALAAAGAGAQQNDTNPPLPNVMLLIDNSGSMERMIDGLTPEADGNACNCTDNGPGQPPSCPGWSTSNATPPGPNRWNIVQTALTGSLQNGFNCVAMPRTTNSTFSSEYQINYQAPYDVGYALPFHRLVYQDKSGSQPAACVVAPGGLPGASLGQGVGPKGDIIASTNATDYASGAIVARQYGLLPPSTKSCTQPTQGAITGFPQYPDGAITSMRDLMRFGMMTFDSDPDPGTGVTGANAVGPAPFIGQWSYFPNWNSGGIPTTYGNPPNCSSAPTLLAVGARNPGAPPWEGRLVPFPTAYDLTAQERNNDEVSSVVLASRPYGATPIAGMFSGAKYFFWTDPAGPQQTDNYVKGMCRNEYIILLTDGAPNLDMEVGIDTSSSPPKYSPACFGVGSPNGTCPFALPQDTAATLYANGNSTASQASVKTYVIGFAVSSFVDQNTPVKCSDYATKGTLQNQCDCTSHTLATSVANLQTDPNIGPCCVLQCIARNGGTNAAYFADTQGDLTSALGSILADIAKNTTTRTTPAYSPVITNVLASQSNPTTNSSIYLASFNPSPGAPWSGNVQRQRYVCTYSGSGYTIPPPTISTALGDDFGANLNSNSGPPRKLIALQPVAVNGVVDSSATLRPYAPTLGGDGLGQLQATVYAGAGSTVDTEITYPALGITAPCPYTSTVDGSPQTLTQQQCSQMLLDYTFGVQSFSGAPSNFKFVSRYGNALGDIYHANPAVVGPPGSLLQDPGYVTFASPSPTGWGSRKTVVYVATNDGLLHAFWADETKNENNELWAMLLPAAMPNLQGSYPSSHSFLLDGSPIVKDVVWDRNITGATNGVGTDWHTMLVAGYGSAQSGYYAVDVTNPDASSMAASALAPGDPPQVGPVFRWQLTKLPTTNMPLFASQAATPAITTLFMDPNDGAGAREIGVAILPGGQGSTPSSSTSCLRTTKSSDSAPLVGYKARTSVRCWGTGKTQAPGDFVPGRAVTIVRVDTGEILRVFARQADMSGYAKDTVATANRFTDVALDSPMTGTPIVYPNDVGTDATKFFIGDADGTLWRFDLSNKDPSKWTGELYLDLYNQDVDTSSTAWNDGQPFDVTPVLSLDPSGNVVINAATGSIQQFDPTGVEYVYSVTEKVAAGITPKLRANVNWYMQPASITNAPGERVSGPMTVFNGTLYFSTFATAPAGTQACVNGSARLWGRDFVTPDDANCATNPSSCNRALGGLREMQPPPPAAPQTPPPVYIEPDLTDPTLAGKVIPGVSIKATPACANLGSATGDQYVYGASHAAPQNFVPGGYSLFTQVGAKGTNGATTRQFETAVPTPVSPTVIDSWAAVLE